MSPIKVSLAMRLCVCVAQTVPLSFIWAGDQLLNPVRSRLMGERRAGSPRASGVPSMLITQEALPTIFKASQPALLSGFARNWALFSLCTPAFLRTSLGDGIVTLLASSASGDDRGFLQETARRVRMPGSEAIDTIFSHPKSDARYYFWGISIRELDTAFDASIGKYHWDRSATSIWVGQKGNITRLHYDIWHGLLAQLTGRKRVVLFPPNESSNLYCDPLFSWSSRPPSKLPTDCLRTDKHLFPKFCNVRRYYETVIGPGDVLYIPPLWWHEVESLDNSISIPLRYSPHWSEVVRANTFPIVLGDLRLLLRRAMKAAGRTRAPRSRALAEWFWRHFSSGHPLG
jgi:hypothetical protein